MWDLQPGSQSGQPLLGHAASISSVAFSSDGKTVASGSRDRTVRLWDAQTGLPLGQPLTGHDDSISSMSFSPTGRILASGSWDHTIRLWDAQTGSSLGQPLNGHDDPISPILFSSDNRTITDHYSAWKTSGQDNFLFEQTVIPYGLSLETPLQCVYEGQWLCLGRDRILWFPEQYREGKLFLQATLFKGKLAYVLDKTLFFFSFSPELGL